MEFGGGSTISDDYLGGGILGSVWAAGSFYVAHEHSLWLLFLLIVPFLIYADAYAAR